jgi:hypothetical protein
METTDYSLASNLETAQSLKELAESMPQGRGVDFAKLIIGNLEHTLKGMETEELIINQEGILLVTTYYETLWNIAKRTTIPNIDLEDYKLRIDVLEASIS